MTRVLLTGAAGQLGFELQRALAPLGELCVCTRDGRLPGGAVCEALDLAEPASILAQLDRLQPSVIVNPAAYTAVDRAESEPELAQRVNAEAVAEMARWCRLNQALLVHYSTDYVFDGRATVPWMEDAATAPLGTYGRSKRDGEVALRESGARHLLLRTAWVYAARGSNFLRTMLRLAGERDELRVVSDQLGSPTPARWIAAATAALLARLAAAPQLADSHGTFHLTAAGETSWHGFASAIMQSAAAAGLLSRLPLVVPISSAEFPTPAQRPAYSVLDGSRLRAMHGLALPDWSVGVDTVIAELAAIRT
jgi:dTDP-4-dehydrorhamnose reductase